MTKSELKLLNEIEAAARENLSRAVIGLMDVLNLRSDLERRQGSSKRRRSRTQTTDAPRRAIASKRVRGGSLSLGR